MDVVQVLIAAKHSPIPQSTSCGWMTKTALRNKRRSFPCILGFNALNTVESITFSGNLNAWSFRWILLEVGYSILHAMLLIRSAHKSPQQSRLRTQLQLAPIYNFVVVDICSFFPHPTDRTPTRLSENHALQTCYVSLFSCNFEIAVDDAGWGS